MKFSPDLDSYACHHLTLFKPDGTTEIDPGEEIGMLSEFQVGEWNPLVVRVHEKPQGTGGSEETLMFKRVVSCEESCIKYLDAVASHIFLEYDFRRANKQPSICDVLAARDGQIGKPQSPSPGVTWWDYKKNDGIQFTTIPLPSLFSVQEWEALETLNRETLKRIYDGQMPRTSSQKPYIVLTHSEYTSPECVSSLKRIATIFGIVPKADDLVVMDESNLS